MDEETLFLTRCYLSFLECNPRLLIGNAKLHKQLRDILYCLRCTLVRNSVSSFPSSSTYLQLIRREIQQLLKVVLANKETRATAIRKVIRSDIH